jgi:signal transduction histidine kinase/HPt (histidine-containing phosphotransfer) domain-containing protein
MDDRPENLHLMRVIFENEGFQVAQAETGEAALALIAAQLPDVALLDVRLPGMSGIETLSKLKVIAPELLVIMITAYGEVSAAVEAMKLGAEDFLIRPIQSDRIVLTVVRAMERRELRAQLEEFNRRKTREQELTRIRDAALELARLKSEFMARVSHEIRTPLNAIVGFTEMLLFSKLDRATRQRVETIRSNCEILMAVVDDLLDYSKLNAGKAALDEAPFELAQLLRETIESFMPGAAAKGLALDWQIDEGLADSMRGDARRLRQVLNNLISNSIKFTAHGHVKLDVRRVESDSDGDLIQFEIADTGIGIPTEIQGRLFQPFVQADSSTSRVYGGTGLGLAIAARVVKQMGGKIWFNTEVDNGSTFYFTARFKKESPQRKSGAAAPAQDLRPFGMGQTFPRRRDGAKRRMSVLVVDDNTSSRSLATLQLSALGYEARTVEDGRRALNELARKNYDIVLMDCEMPGMDGYTTTAEIRRREGSEKHIVVIAMTAHAFEAVRSRCLACGMDDFLAKPVTLSAMVKVLELWTARIESGETARLESPSAPKLSSSQLDDGYINELHLLSPAAGTDVFESLVNSFLSEVPAKIAELKLSIGSKDVESLRQAAHALKGAANTVGAVGFARVCSTVQETAEKSDMDAACAGAHNLIEEAGAIRQILESAVKARAESYNSNQKADSR